MIILESPTTLLFNVVDLEGVAKLAQEHGIKTYIDNTYSTPAFPEATGYGNRHCYAYNDKIHRRTQRPGRWSTGFQKMNS